MDEPPHNSVFTSLPSGVCVVDGEGRILDMNPAFERLLGWCLADRRGQRLASCLEQAITDPAQALCWIVALSQALDQGKTTFLNLPVEMRGAAEDQCPLSAFGSIAPWHDSGGEPRGAVVELCETRVLQDLEGVRGRFLAVVSHELGSPLNNLAAAVDLLVTRLDRSDREQWKYLEIIQAEIRRVQRLLAQFLSPDSMGMRDRGRNMDIITLRPLLDRVVTTYEIRDRERRFEAQLPADLPFVQGDADRIVEILSNLVDNAMRYSPPSTPILLTVEARAKDVLVCVVDQGPGIAEEDEARLFDLGWRGEQAQQVEGQGMGLPVSRILVQSLGGELWYEPNQEGGGSFCFTVPKAAPLRELL
jgi:two-component system phosphate regulon sensor histidine kinase PhoR